MVSKYNAIYLSPHLDDAALSCGGQIYQRTQAGQSVLIVTVMAGDPVETAVSDYIQSLHKRWELLAEPVVQRRVEDRKACAILRADYAHWQMPDCIYRWDQQTGDPFYGSDDEIFGDLHPADIAQEMDKLAAQITALPSHDELIIPLTIGNHVDHQLVRMAAEHCFGSKLLYYEDYPYAQDEEAVETMIDRICWHSETVMLNETAVLARINAVAAFTSQLSTFFNGRSDLEQKISTYIEKVNGERIWRRKPD
ncbi:MAG: PIG-L family deacetylase [Chloroflexi bacterium]|nr:PIG-L family deacetylase [Chloroflexota bacterium]